MFAVSKAATFPELSPSTGQGRGVFVGSRMMHLE